MSKTKEDIFTDACAFAERLCEADTADDIEEVVAHLLSTSRNEADSRTTLAALIAETCCVISVNHGSKHLKYLADALVDLQRRDP